MALEIKFVDPDTAEHTLECSHIDCTIAANVREILTTRKKTIVRQTQSPREHWIIHGVFTGTNADTYRTNLRTWVWTWWKESTKATLHWGAISTTGYISKVTISEDAGVEDYYEWIIEFAAYVDRT